MAKTKATKANVLKLDNPAATTPGIAHDNFRTLTPELRAEFQALMAQDPAGLLKPEIVVKRAESQLSPLHKFFTWDDEKAADEWRLMQARYLIRSFRIEIEPLQIVPAFVSLKDDRYKGGGYTWMGEVIQPIDLKRNLIYTVISDIENLLRKIEDYPEIQPLRQAISAALAKMGDTPTDLSKS